MGLCKCPKKKVTNQFCFEHRVNVCENCMVTSHPKCIVQSYLQWLQDSDYSPLCQLCSGELAREDCVRLICYHVFHWKCLDQHSQQLPDHTAPAGYTCPTCKQQMFPATNLVSPVADRLRTVLGTVNWARAGLGLSLVEETASDQFSTRANTGSDLSLDKDSICSSTPDVHILPTEAFHQTEDLATSQSTNSVPYGDWSARSHVSQSASSADQQVTYAPSQHSTTSISMADSFHSSSTLLAGVNSPRKMYDSSDIDGYAGTSRDPDENKYQRRSALEWLARFYKNAQTSRWRRDPRRGFRKNMMIGVLAVLATITLVVIFIQYGRSQADNDPFLDPMSNPNIRIQTD